MSRQTLSDPELLASATQAVEELIAALQSGWDTSSADVFDAPFAADVVWGSPFGQTISGYDKLNQLHKMIMSKGALPKSVYEIVNVLALREGAVVAHVRRRNLGEGEGKEGEGKDVGEDLAGKKVGDGRFDEMAMYVLIKREGRWWLAAGQNTVVGEAPKRG
jgi:uncharacterized protein (TIGR02246 family)